jgi:hypothetical protein
MMGFVLAALTCSIDADTATAKDHDRGDNHDNGRYENRGRGYERDRHVRRRRVYRESYRERRYEAPPVIFAPPPPPGIGIFLPPFPFRR